MVFESETLAGPPLWYAPQFVVRLADQPKVMPALKIQRQAAEIVLSWPGMDSGVAVETAPSLQGSSWTVTPEKPVMENGQNVLWLRLDAAERYYRLRR